METQEARMQVLPALFIQESACSKALAACEPVAQARALPVAGAPVQLQEPAAVLHAHRVQQLAQLVTELNSHLQQQQSFKHSVISNPACRLRGCTRGHCC